MNQLSINPPKGLYGILLQRLEELDKSCPKEIIPFRAVFGKICRNFSINKQQCWELLFFMRDMGFVEIVACHGIRIINR